MHWYPFIGSSFSRRCVPEIRRVDAGETTRLRMASSRSHLRVSFSPLSNVSVRLSYSSYGIYIIAPFQLLKFELQ